MIGAPEIWKDLPDRALPEAQIGPEDVLVRVHASALNRARLASEPLFLKYD